jgi:hypothetical protein
VKEGEIASWPVRVKIGLDKVCWDFNIHVMFNVTGSDPNERISVLAVAHFGCWETSFDPGIGQHGRRASLHKRAAAVLDVPNDLGNHT